MATRHSNRTSASVKTRAVAYIRRSTTKQEQSLEGQRFDIERFAEENGYRIVRWYKDDGISGDATDKRVGFQQMHRDATNGRDFDVILSWDLSRFGRFDSIEAGRWVDPLRRAGVKLVTVKEGPADWTSFEGRVMSAINSEAKHQFLLGIAEQASRGKIQRAQEGHLCGQSAPYGYDRLEVDQNGEPQGRLAAGSRVRNRSWRVTLVPSDDPIKVRTLKWLFDQYANTSIGLRSLADSLNERGVPAPGGGSWWIGTIREILRNQTYTGDFVWAKRQMGKYRRVAGTTVKKRDSLEMTAGGNPSVRHNAPEEWIVVRDAHPALVDRSTFEIVQEKLATRKHRTARRRQGSEARYLLSGIVRCAHCGQPMYGTRTTRKKENKSGQKRTYEYFRYHCSTYHTQGKARCSHNTIDEAPLTEFLVDLLRQSILGSDNKAEFRKVVRARIKARAAKGSAGDAAALKRRLAELDREIEQGAKRILKAPDSIVDVLSEELAKTRKERDRIASELTQAAEQSKPLDVDAEVEATLRAAWTLGAELDKADPARLREMFRRMVESIDCYFEQEPRSTRTVSRFSKAIINLRNRSELSQVVSRDDRI